MSRLQQEVAPFTVVGRGEKSPEVPDLGHNTATVEVGAGRGCQELQHYWGDLREQREGRSVES